MGNGLSLLFLRVTLIKLDGFDEQGAGEALGDRGFVAARALGAGGYQPGARALSVPRFLQHQTTAVSQEREEAEPVTV